MSSHREAPEISKDPVADSSDLYAFVSPTNRSCVTLIANYVPLQGPDGGPNFFEFGDDVLYEIHIDNNGDGWRRRHLPVPVHQRDHQPNTFLYNTGPILGLGDSTWNRRQTYSVTRVDNRCDSKVLASGVPCPPCNIGPLSTPDYPALAADAIVAIAPGTKVFAGQRAEGFYVDLGAIFDLGDPEAVRAGPHHVRTGQHRPGQDGQRCQLHRRGQCPQHRHRGPDQRPHVQRLGTDHRDRPPCRARRVDDGQPTEGPAPRWSVDGGAPAVADLDIGTADPGVAARQPTGERSGHPPGGQGLLEHPAAVARTRSSPPGYAHPELAGLLPVLYPGVFPKLAAYNAYGGGTGGPVGHPPHRHPGRSGPRVPELHRARPRPTCSDSTWPSRPPPRGRPTSV